LLSYPKVVIEYRCQLAGTYQNVFTDAVSVFGKIDVLVSNAGYLPILAFVHASLNNYWRRFEVNAKGGITVAQVFLKIAGPGATIIIVTAGVAHIPSQTCP
jgi:NAD(P)-dependent dehydrogenase (short-subunit alcohol dehydrogenase family)